MKKMILFAVLALAVVAVQAQQDSAKFYTNQGNLAVNEARFADAVSSYDKAFVHHATAGTVDTALYFNYGIAAFKGNMFEKAGDAFSKCIELKYKAETAHTYAVNSYFKASKEGTLSDAAKYEKSLDAALAADPASDKFKKLKSQLVIDRAVAFEKEGADKYRAAGAETDFQKADQLTAEYIAAYDKAIAAYLQVLELDPANAAPKDAVKRIGQKLGEDFYISGEAYYYESVPYKERGDAAKFAELKGKADAKLSAALPYYEKIVQVDPAAADAKARIDKIKEMLAYK